MKTNQRENLSLSQSIKSFFMEKIPAYLLLLLTRRWITIDLLQIEESIGPFETIAFSMKIRGPSLREKKKFLRIISKDDHNLIPTVWLLCASEEIIDRKFPRTTVIMHFERRKLVLIVPKRERDLDF